MRWAYIKNGDAVEQVERIRSSSSLELDGGPDAFLADFLADKMDEAILVISCGRRNASYKANSVQAKTIKAQAPGGIKIEKAILQLSSISASAYYLIKFRPNYIICGRVGPLLWLSFIISKAFRIPLIHSRHNSIDEYRASFFRRMSGNLEKRMLRNIDGVICHGPYLLDQLNFRLGIAREKIIEFDVGYKSYLSTPDPKNILEKLPQDSSGKLIFYIGRISRNKGVFDLLEAFEEVLTVEPDLYLVIVGKGEDSEELEREVKAQDLSSRVLRLGFCSIKEIPVLLSQAHIVVTPSRKEFPEGRCMVLMESLVMGVPVIAPDYGPFPYLVKDHTNGLLYQPNSNLSLKNCILNLVQNENLYITLCDGAKISGHELLEPDIRFSQAVNQAFHLST